MQIRVFTAFSGYDSQCMALDRLKVNHPDFDYDLVGWSEIDKYAIAAHNAVYPQYAERNYGDITKIDWASVPDFDLFTYSSPCQDFSVAGLQRGGQKGSGTRSSLLWECERAIEAKRPKYLLLENVKNILSTAPNWEKDEKGNKVLDMFGQPIPLPSNRENLARWEKVLNDLGYDNYIQVLNTKDSDVPQNRERCFMVSVLRYQFPTHPGLTKCLADVLDDKVDERYFMSDEKVAELLENVDMSAIEEECDE